MRGGSGRKARRAKPAAVDFLDKAGHGQKIVPANRGARLQRPASARQSADLRK
jgi:hypothetical protein